jgi:hypothetical protein
MLEPIKLKHAVVLWKAFAMLDVLWGCATILTGSPRHVHRVSALVVHGLWISVCVDLVDSVRV